MRAQIERPSTLGRRHLPLVNLALAEGGGCLTFVAGLSLAFPWAITGHLSGLPAALPGLKPCVNCVYTFQVHGARADVVQGLQDYCPLIRYQFQPLKHCETAPALSLQEKPNRGR